MCRLSEWADFFAANGVQSSALNRYARLGLPQPSGMQYEIVDGFTSIRQVRFSLPLSFWRKLIYFVALFTLPAIAGADAAFYAEPISDLLGPAVSIAVYFLFMKRELERRRAADGPPEAQPAVRRRTAFCAYLPITY